MIFKNVRFKHGKGVTVHHDVRTGEHYSKRENLIRTDNSLFIRRKFSPSIEAVVESICNRS
jgi:hypothetical protein